MVSHSYIEPEKCLIFLKFCECLSMKSLKQITYICVAKRRPNRYQLRLEWITRKYFKAIKIPMIIH